MFRITLNRVHDRILIKEGDENLALKVDCDARMIVTKIRQANELIVKANKEGASEFEKEFATRQFSEAIFGQEQTEKLMEFYNNDYSCVITVCGMYFEKRLSKKISAAQKKLK